MHKDGRLRLDDQLGERASDLIVCPATLADAPASAREEPSDRPSRERSIQRGEEIGAVRDVVHWPRRLRLRLRGPPTNRKGSILIHPMRLPTSSRARMSAPTFINRS